MATVTDERSIATRRLILHDSLSFLSLLLVTVVLFAVTLFLFRSFSAHRVDLAHRWSDRGIQAMRSGKPEEAIVALRTALSYAPDTQAYELLLAQALGQAGHIDESYNYFMGLWTAEPGNGFINLQLARLAVKRAADTVSPNPAVNEKARAEAINFYRASIYGTWEGDGVARRAEVRLELARYLIAIHELAPARMELLIAGGNAPADPALDQTLGDLLEQSADPADAWTYYQKAIAADPTRISALEAAGRLAYQSGDFEAAHRMLLRAQAVRARDRAAAPLSPADATLLADSTRILELRPSRALPRRERVARILADRAIAQKRLQACVTQFAPSTALPTALQSLNTRWAAPDGTANAAALLADPDQQDSAMQLVYDTELQTAKLCTAPAGDDALLLLLAGSGNAAPLPQPAEASR
jgi:tetratricopeptide (TPR) repeat protein